MVLQDIFSRFLFTAPLKQKTAAEVIKGLRSIFAKGRKPKKLRTDKGSEFKNKWVKSFLKKEEVHSIYTENETKSNFAERSIQKLENRLHRIFVQNDSYKFVDELANITQSINATPTRPLGDMAPVDVTKGEAMFSAFLERTKSDKQTNVKRVSLKGKKQRKRYFKFKVNDRVRILHLKHTFQREYDQKWTCEIFVITHRFRRQGNEVYRLNDYADEFISGTFYAQELQKVNKKEDTVWKVDKILK